GPDTLRELRDDDIAALGMRPPQWADMHDLGDMLVSQGLASPVMDMEVLRLRWADADAALRELAQLGRAPHELASPGLRTPRSWRRLRELLQARAAAAPHGQVELRFELVYGHAFKPATSRAEQGVASIGVEQIGGRRRPKSG
ncbi:MAG: SAM-dependent methyltransferase, partial [Betaproteobacteria bacterium]|nr:SAM-dependent methyltransferase [Betaproteobacteria bacterium]